MRPSSCLAVFFISALTPCPRLTQLLPDACCPLRQICLVDKSGLPTGDAASSYLPFSVTLPQLTADDGGAASNMVCVAVPDALCPPLEDSGSLSPAPRGGDCLLLADLARVLGNEQDKRSPKSCLEPSEVEAGAIRACVLPLPEGRWVEDLAFYREGRLAALINDGLVDHSNERTPGGPVGEAGSSHLAMIPLDGLDLHPVSSSELRNIIKVKVLVLLNPA